MNVDIAPDHQVITGTAGNADLAEALLEQAEQAAAMQQQGGLLLERLRNLGTLLGTVATVIAVMAVASIGFMMLTGRMNWRFGATVIIGVFILFGATTIVAGIQSAAG